MNVFAIKFAECLRKLTYFKFQFRLCWILSASMETRNGLNCLNFYYTNNNSVKIYFVLENLCTKWNFNICILSLVPKDLCDICPSCLKPALSLNNLIKISPFIPLFVCFCRSWKDLTQPRLRHVLLTSCRDLFNL